MTSTLHTPPPVARRPVGPFTWNLWLIRRKVREGGPYLLCVDSKYFSNSWLHPVWSKMLSKENSKWLGSYGDTNFWLVEADGGVSGLGTWAYISLSLRLNIFLSFFDWQTWNSDRIHVLTGSYWYLGDCVQFPPDDREILSVMWEEWLLLFVKNLHPIYFLQMIEHWLLSWRIIRS